MVCKNCVGSLGLVGAPLIKKGLRIISKPFFNFESSNYLHTCSFYPIKSVKYSKKDLELLERQLLYLPFMIDITCSLFTG